MSNSALSPINSELLENIISIILDYKDKSFNDISIEICKGKVKYRCTATFKDGVLYFAFTSTKDNKVLKYASTEKSAINNYLLNKMFNSN
jgi:hypothetical protein